MYHSHPKIKHILVKKKLNNWKILAIHNNFNGSKLHNILSSRAFMRVGGTLVSPKPYYKEQCEQFECGYYSNEFTIFCCELEHIHKLILFRNHLCNMNFLSSWRLWIIHLLLIHQTKLTLVYSIYYHFQILRTHSVTTCFLQKNIIYICYKRNPRYSVTIPIYIDLR